MSNEDSKAFINVQNNKRKNKDIKQQTDATELQASDLGPAR